MVKLLDDELEEDLVQRWGWNRPQEGSAHERIRPTREMKDLYEVDNLDGLPETMLKHSATPASG